KCFLNKFLLFCCCFICAGVFADVWKVQVESEMEALVSSCVVLPCSFKYPAQQQPSDRIRAIWHMKDNWDDIIFHEDSTRVKDSFNHRTRLIGSLGASNCSLEIDEISVNDKYSFMDNCAEQSVQEGQPTVFKCSVQHTCPSHQPTLSWSHPGHWSWKLGTSWEYQGRNYSNSPYLCERYKNRTVLCMYCFM
uniref:Immunoglobulin V-set domain-containing protein n=1 Tax=Cyprinus carpio TaxID=7962 RepID=A0A8C2EDY8_CYPCA